MIQWFYPLFQQLAKLHALLIAMRRLQPALYYSRVDPHMHTIYEDSAMEGVIKRFEVFIQFTIGQSNYLQT